MIEVNNNKYQVIETNIEKLEMEELQDKLTDYFDDFDYIVGDYAYSKLRLKGFNKKENPNFKNINDFAKKDEYLQNYCAYGCKYFILEKIKKT